MIVCVVAVIRLLPDVPMLPVPIARLMLPPLTVFPAVCVTLPEPSTDSATLLVPVMLLLSVMLPLLPLLVAKLRF